MGFAEVVASLGPSCSVIPKPDYRYRCEKPPTVIDWMRPESQVRN